MFRDWIRLTKLILPLLALLLMIAGCDGDGKPTRTLEVTVAAKGGGAAQPITPMSPPESGTAAVPPTLAARSTEEPGSKVPRILDMSAISDAVSSGYISDVDALMYQVFAQFGVLKKTSTFMKLVSGEEETSSLSHTAFTTLLMQADSLPEPYVAVLRRLMPNDSNLTARAAAPSAAKVTRVLSIPTPPWLGDIMDDSSSEWPQHNSCYKAFYNLQTVNGGWVHFCFPWLLPEPYDPNIDVSNGGGLTPAQKTRALEIRDLLNRVSPQLEQVLHLGGWKHHLYIQMHEDTTISFPGLPVPGETDGSFIYGYANQSAPWDPGTSGYWTTDYGAQSGVCHIWLFGSGEWQATITHEFFHCLQYSKRVFTPDWLMEGTATWAEHIVNQHYEPPRPHMEHFRATRNWTTWFEKDFTDRTNDVLFPLLYAEFGPGGGGIDAIGAMLRASCCEQDALEKLPLLFPGDFPTLWQEVSVMGFNQDPPVEKLDDNGAQLAFTPQNGPLEMQPVELNKGTEDRFDLSIAPYSKRLYLFEFQEETKPELSRLHLDLSEVPEPFRITAITKVDGEWEKPPIDLSQEIEYVFCRMKVGLCADAVESDELDEDEIKNYETIALVITNVTRVEESLTLRFHTYNPHLHGQWKRTQMTADIMGYVPPFVVVNTKLTFDESVSGTSNDWMKEETGNYQLQPDLSTWQCDYGGSYRVYMRSASPDAGSPDYEYLDWNPNEAHDKTNSVGFVRYIPGQGQSLIPWRNMCTYTHGPGYGSSSASNLHIPLTSSPDLSIGFKIVEDDTLIISLPGRTYVYERTSHDP